MAASNQESQQKALSELDIKNFVFDPIFTTKEEILNSLRKKPKGFAAKIGNYVYVSNGSGQDLSKTLVDKIPLEWFLGKVGNIEREIAKLKQRLLLRSRVASIHDYTISIVDPGSVFSTPYETESLVFLCDSDKNKGGTFFDLVLVPLGTQKSINLSTEALFFNNKRSSGWTHTGDDTNPPLYHGVSTGDVKEGTLAAMCYTGYRKTALHEFKKQVPMGCIVDHDNHMLHVVRAPLERVTVGENNHALVAVCMRYEGRLWWYIPPVPELAAGVNSGDRTSKVRALETRAYGAALEAFAKAGVFYLVEGAPEAKTEVSASTHSPSMQEEKQEAKTSSMSPVEKSCNACGSREEPLKTCSRCKITRYCSKECQKSDWKKHKGSCTSPARPQASLAPAPAQINTVQTVQGGVPPSKLLSIPEQYGETLYVSYTNYVDLGPTPKEMEIQSEYMLPLASVSELNGNVPVIALGGPPKGSLPLSRSRLKTIQKEAAAYIMHFTPNGLTDNLVLVPDKRVNGLGFLHLLEEEKNAKVLESLLSPQELKVIEEKVKQARNALGGQRLSLEEKEKIKALQAPLDIHKQTIKNLLQHANVTTFTAQLGPCGTGIMEIVSRYFMYRQGAVIPGLFDDLYTPGDEVTSIVKNLPAWVATGGLQNCGFPVMTERSDKRVLMGSEMIAIEQCYKYLSGIKDVRDLGEQSVSISQVIRQLPYILAADEIKEVKRKLISAVSKLISRSEELDEVNSEIAKITQNLTRLNRKKIRQLIAKKKGLLARNNQLVAALVGEINNLSSKLRSTTIANQEKMGFKLVKQLIHTQKNLDEVEKMSPMEVLEFVDGRARAVLLVELQKGPLETVLGAIQDGKFLEFAAKPENPRNLVSVGLQGVSVDGLTSCAMSQGARKERKHLLVVDEKNFQGLLLPAKPSAGHAPSWRPEQTESGNVATDQNSLMPAFVLKRFVNISSLIQPWQTIANEDDVQKVRQLLRRQVACIRGYNISASSPDLSFFFMVSDLELLDKYCALSPSKEKTTLSVEEQASLELLGKIQKQLAEPDSVEVEGGTAGGSTTSTALVTTLEAKQEKLLNSIRSGNSGFFDERTTNIRGIFMSVLAASAAGKVPVLFVYQLFSPGRKSFRTPPGGHFFLYPWILRLARETGCPMEPVVQNTRRFILGELWKYFQFLWQPMRDRVAKIDALEQKKAEENAEDKLKILRIIIPVVFHLSGIPKTPANAARIKGIAGRALRFFPEEFKDQHAPPHVGGDGLGILLRCFIRVYKGTYKWKRLAQILQHASNIYVKHSNFMNEERRKLFTATQESTGTKLQRAFASFYAECFKHKALVSGRGGDGVDEEVLLETVKEEYRASSSRPYSPVENHVLALKRVQLLDEKLQLESSEQAGKDTTQGRIKDIDQDVKMLDDILRNPVVARGPKDVDSCEEDHKDLYIIVGGDISDPKSLKEKLDHAGVPWSVQTVLQQAQARRRSCEKGKDPEGVKECDKEIRSILAGAEMEAKAAQQDTNFVITGQRLSEKKVVKEGTKDLAEYGGKNSKVIKPLLEMGPCSSDAVKFCQELDDLDFTGVWSKAKSPLDSKIFIEVLELVGIPHGVAVSFLREVLLTFLSSWRDRDAAFEAALPLFLSYEKASPASD